MGLAPGESGSSDYERLYALLIDDLQEYAIFLMDLDGTIRSWNPGVERILGYGRYEWTGQNVAIIFSPESRREGCPEEERERAARLGHASDARWHLRKDGSRFWVEGVVTAIHDRKGQLVAFSKIMRDSTDRYETEQQLREGERWWKQIVETAAEGICVLDPDGRFTFANDRLCEMLGCPAGALTGRSVFDYFFDEDRDAALERYQRRSGSERLFTVARLRTVSNEELWVRTAASQVSDSSGHVTGMLAMLSDITRPRRDEIRLRQSEERLRSMIASATEYALVQLDSDTRITGWDAGAERLFGWRRDEVIGSPFDILFTPEDRIAGVIRAEYEQALTTGSAGNDRWMLRKDGTRIWAIGALMPIRNGTGGHRGFLKILRDFTNRKRQEDEKSRAVEVERHRLQVRIASTESELRRLNSALMTAQEAERRLIARELHDDVVQRLAWVEMKLADIGNSAKDAPETAALLQLRHEVGDVSERLRSLSHGLHSAVLDQLGLSTALGGMARQMSAATSRQIRFASRHVPRVLPSEVSTNLYRIAQEACQNALRHGCAASIYVSLYTTDCDLRLTVRDNGQGFDPDAVRSRGGLGLVTMSERSQMIGGRIQVASSPGRGTKIRVAIALDEIG